MEKKKRVLTGTLVIGVLIAGGVFCRGLFSNSSENSGERNIVLWCSQCGGFEIPDAEFRHLLSNHPDDMMSIQFGQTIALKCPKCGQKTCYRAHKCQHCDHIFVLGQAKDPQCPDRCPKCKFSATENQ